MVLMSSSQCIICATSIVGRGNGAKTCSVVCAAEKDKRYHRVAGRESKRYRYHTDLEYRDLMKARSKAYFEAQKDDPEYRERRRLIGRQVWARNPPSRQRKQLNRALFRDSYRKRSNIYALLNRDGWYCSWCGEILIGDVFDGRLVHIDHIVPRSKSGTNDLSNLQLLHADCNVQKRDRL